METKLNDLSRQFARFGIKASVIFWSVANETGANPTRTDAKQGNHGPVNQRWTEEQQAYVFRHNFDMYARVPQIRGFAPWILMDFRSAGRNIPRLQDDFNRKGLIAEDGKRKLSFYLVQKVYREKKIGKAD